MALIDSLISYWKLDEASGNALDAHGTNDLTENGTGGIGTATGIINGGRDFEAGDSDYFSHTDNTDLSTGDIDFSWQCWLKFESTPGANMCPISKWLGSGGNKEFILFWDNGANRLRWGVSSDGSAFAGIQDSVYGAISTGVWLHVICWHDSVNNQLGLAINNGTPVTGSYSSGVRDGAAGLSIGRNDDGSQNYFDGIIDEVGFWKRVLTSAERTELYNSGAGLAYPFSGGVVLPNGIIGGGVGSGAFILGA